LLDIRGSRYGRGYRLPPSRGFTAGQIGAIIAKHRQECAMTPAEIDSLIMELRKHTPLHRLPLQEAKQIFEVLLAWGYVLTAPATPPAER
jgi:hypothetical protein